MIPPLPLDFVAILLQYNSIMLLKLYQITINNYVITFCICVLSQLTFPEGQSHNTMNIQTISYIVEIANYGSISEAAKRLFVTQPYLSKILRDTEKEYGLTIFTREKSGIIPTESGRLFLDMSRDLIEHTRHFQQTFQEYSTAYRLRISASSCSHASDVFVRMLSSLKDSPCRFSYRETTYFEVIRDVYANRADVGFIMYPQQKAKQINETINLHHLKMHILFKSHAFLFCRIGHPILKNLDNLTPPDLYKYGFVLYPDDCAHAHAMESLYDIDMLHLINWAQVSQVTYVNSRAALHDIIRRTDFLGIGITSVFEQAASYQLMSFPLPKWLQMKDRAEKEYICAYLTQSSTSAVSKSAQLYINLLEKFYGTESAATSSQHVAKP